MLLENYYLPGDLENQIGAFIEHYNHERYHESLSNVTPADAYFGRTTAIIERRKRIKNLTIKNRRLNHQRKPLNINQGEPDPPLNQAINWPKDLDDGQRDRRPSPSPRPAEQRHYASRCPPSPWTYCLSFTQRKPI